MSKRKKIFDAIYWGGIHSEENFKIVDSIKDFKYNFREETTKICLPCFANIFN